MLGDIVVGLFPLMKKAGIPTELWVIMIIMLFLTKRAEKNCSCVSDSIIGGCFFFLSAGQLKDSAAR